MNRKESFRWLVTVAVLLAVITGFVLYTLIPIPFGTLFNAFQIIFIFSLLSLMVLTAMICFRNKRLWLKLIGILPVMAMIMVLIAAIVINTGYRMLYFKGIPTSPDKKEWIEDLHSLSEQLSEKHADLEALVSKHDLNETVKEVEEHIADYTTAEIQMCLFRTAALLNDCHTFPFIMMPAFDLHSFPFKVYVFFEGLYVVDAGRGYKDLIGARIIKIGTKTLDEIYNKFSLFFAVENEYGYKERFTYMVMMPEWLYYHGIIDNVKKADFTFENKESELINITVPSVNYYAHFLWANMFPVDNDAPPVYAAFRKNYYRYSLFDDQKTLYIQFNQCDNQPGRETMVEFTTRMEEDVRNIELECCIVDIRNNDGGNRVWSDLVRFLRDDERFNRSGGLLVLIGRRTFSSAVIFATQLQLQTKAVFLGEPTGQGPVFYSSPTFAVLPHSRLPFSISSQRTVAGMPFDQRHAIHPDIPVKYTISDFLNQRDPVMEEALTYQVLENRGVSVPAKKLHTYIGCYLFSPVRVLEVILDGKVLKLKATDFLPGSLFRLNSDLYYNATTNAFHTDIPDVKIKFSGNKKESVQAKLDWMGKEIVQQRAVEGYSPATGYFAEENYTKGCEEIRSAPDIYKKHISNLENMLNRIGYTLLGKDNILSALEVFSLNVELFPNSWNVYDSYGEAFVHAGNRDEAVVNYKKSLKLNPESVSG